jgi:transposase
VWLPDDRIRGLRRQVTRRAHLVRQRTRIKNQVHAILARNLAPTPPVADLFGKTGRHWLARQLLPADQCRSVQALVRQLDFHGDELAMVYRELAIEAFADPVVTRLVTIPGIDAIAAISIVAAIGDFTRFTDADKLVAYVGLNPKVAGPGTPRRCTAGSAKPAAPMSAACSSRRPGRPATHPDPYAHSTSGSRLAAGSRPRWSLLRRRLGAAAAAYGRPPGR